MKVRRALLLMMMMLLMSTTGPAQTPPPAVSKPKSESQMGGVSTGGTYAPVKDAKNRPITAGGLVDGAPVAFEDITQKSGLAGFQHASGTAEKTSLLEAPGSGVALLDYHNVDRPHLSPLHASTYHAKARTQPPP